MVRAPPARTGDRRPQHPHSLKRSRSRSMHRAEETINIIQYNVHKSKDQVMRALNAVLRPDYHHIVAIQEPWRNPRMHTTIRPANYELAYPSNAKTRACFYVSKHLDAQRWKITERSPDLITLSIELEDRKLHIHNCYNEPPRSTTSQARGVLDLLPAALAEPGEHLLVGDFNLHHPFWGGSTVLVQHALADALIDITEQAQLQLTLPPGTVTWQSRQSESTLDLAFATEWIAQRLLQCQPHEEVNSDSDYIPIITSILAAPIARREPRAQRAWKRTD
ncbi:hypothetical protein CB0940_12191 [Cercospora beticola]|uniref:Endonuclease/exonuclease/phosphatase domain-containing protein n=1 Tax=Cercospora beticola TaxID=122368 RepID=A0A2G5GRR7_CERBT|nr:hypothetical protein CB0940_12191 [Cercospora beticola]PIA82976.1 hypothetical protein CB0940_12191 [Cercospora beticola]